MSCLSHARRRAAATATIFGILASGAALSSVDASAAGIASAQIIVPVRRAPARFGEFANYGIWDMKVEELAPGPDGHWQAVVRVRDAAIYRVGLTDDGVMITLFDEDGRSVQSIPTLFRASVTGKTGDLEPIPQIMWMEKGDEVRVRLYLRQSAGFKPVRVRVGSNDRETFSRTFDFK